MKLKFFNLIEVTLAIAVVGVGISGIMSVFPVALSASRDAVGNNYSALIADQFLSFASLMASKDSENGKAWTDATTFIGGLTQTFSAIPTDEASAVDIASGTISQEYKMSQGSAACTDFTAIVRIWKSPITKMYVAGYTVDEVPYKYAAAVHVEVSWPSAIPYAQRQKRYYSIELYNTNPL